MLTTSFMLQELAKRMDEETLRRRINELRLSAESGEVVMGVASAVTKLFKQEFPDKE